MFVVILAGYIFTLAPTVTFWDAGEFLAASRILGVPHPPGTPVFVFLSNAWAQLVPLGDFAYRVNLLTAVFSAAASALIFLLVLRALQRNGEADPVFAFGGAAAAALVSAFAFTVWQNSNESEVYMVAGANIAACSWLAWMWRKHRGTSRASHMLLLMVYLGAFSIGNHLLTLLVGPALIGFVWHVQRTEPAPTEAERRIEWAQWAVLGGIWALLIGTGLGSTNLMILAGLVFIGAGAYASATGGARFAAAVLVVAAVGVSTYLFLYLRAGHAPFINEADPSTWDSLLAVIRREQYPPRSPTDNPIFPSGPQNPGRTLTILALQIQNYIQYFDWQWSNSLATAKSYMALERLPFTLMFVSLGVFGANILRERDRSVFWLIILIFLITGPGLVAYMNFKPGFSIGFEQFPDAVNHEVRERDYFFIVSFQMWGVLAGIGIAGLYRIARTALGERTGWGRLALPVFGLAAVPMVLNFSAASRAHGPETGLARDFAYDLLQSIEPYGIVFTNGDNDTFPLWYAQEVEEIRQDVSVVNLSLGNTDWYVRQLRDNPVRPFDPEQAPWFVPLAPATPPGPLHSWTDDQVAQMRPDVYSQDISFQAGRINHTIPAGTPLYVKDVLILRLIQENLGKRPVYFSTTAGSGNWVGLGEYLVQEGLALRLYSEREPDLSRLGQGLLGQVPVDLPRTDSLVWDIYRYAGLFDADTLELDPTNRNIASNLSLPFMTLYFAYDGLGDRERSVQNLRRAYHLTPSPDLKRVLDMAESPPPIFGDTTVPGDSTR